MKKNPFLLSLLISSGLISTTGLALQPVHVQTKASEDTQIQAEEPTRFEDSQEFQILAAFYQMIHQTCGGQELIAIEQELLSALQDYLIAAVEFKQAQEVSSEQEAAMDSIIVRCKNACDTMINYFVLHQSRLDAQLPATYAAKLMFNVHIIHAVPVLLETELGQEMAKNETSPALLMDSLHELAIYLAPLFN